VIKAKDDWMYQYNNARELLNLCQDKNINLPEAIILSEIEETAVSRENILSLLHNRWAVMEDAVLKGLNPELKSMGGLIGGNSAKLNQVVHQDNLSGPTILKAVSYALAVTEYNAAMGKIVAAPTGGSSGILPGILLALKEDKGYTKQQICEALLVAAGIGKIIANNATLSGAQGGCQAECGAASAMAAAGAVYLGQGTPDMSMEAAAMALKGLLGLVCDPVAGLVEVPCSKRNATATANAMVAADMALAGIKSFIPFDEVVEAMYRVGELMSPDLKETARAGCAATPAALSFGDLKRIN
jgi:L-serine dehydratase